MELRYPSGEKFLKPGEAWGDVDAMAVQGKMIRQTIKEYLDKEKRLRPQGIKGLTLFFIEEVSRYRQCDEDGHLGTAEGLVGVNPVRPLQHQVPVAQGVVAIVRLLRRRPRHRVHARPETQFIHQPSPAAAASS